MYKEKEREGGTEVGRKGGREEGREEGREGGREGGREEGREGGREGGREEGRKGGREGGRFFRPYLHYCQSSVHDCEERFYVHFLNRSSNI